MRNRMTNWAPIAAMTLLLIAPARAADGPTLSQDLTSVIALLGLPCGQVVRSTRQAENDYIATCRDGNRYRVFLNAEGRVVAQKQ
jgi:hypothetical protein